MRIKAPHFAPRKKTPKDVKKREKIRKKTEKIPKKRKKRQKTQGSIIMSLYNWTRKIWLCQSSASDTLCLQVLAVACLARFIYTRKARTNVSFQPDAHKPARFAQNSAPNASRDEKNINFPVASSRAPARAFIPLPGSGRGRRPGPGRPGPSIHCRR